MGVAEVAPFYIIIAFVYLYMNNNRNGCHHCHPHMARKYRRGPGWSAAGSEKARKIGALRSFKVGRSTVPARVSQSRSR